jgi:hypothetical protein
LPIFPADGDVDLRAFIGGYYFANSDVDTVAGPRGRLEVRLYDLELLGVQSRLTIDGEVQWDSPRGTQGFGGLELRIPLGVVTGTPGAKLSPLDRRMVDRVQRDVDIVTQKYQSDPHDVVVDGLTGKTHTIVFAEEGGSGTGTKGNPTNLLDAPALAAAKGKNAIIVVKGDAGPITLSGQPVQLANGQALLGGDSHVVLRDAGDSGIRANFHAPGARPTILGTDSAANLIDMASGGQNRVTGLDLAGSFDAAIFGLNMERAIITDNFIDPPAGNGIFLQNSGGPVPTNQLAYIARNSVEGAASAGIAVKSYLADGLAHTQTIIIVDNTITNAGGHGIEHTASDSGITSLTEAVLIAGNSISTVGGYGIAELQALNAIPGVVSQRLAIYDNSVTGAVGGIRVARAASQLGGLYQGVAIGRNSLGAIAGTGIAFSEAFASVSGAAISTVSISGNSIGSAGGNGIAFGLFAGSLGSLSQAIAIDGNSLGAIAGHGIVFAEAILPVSGAAIQNLSISYNTISNAGGDGIDFTLAAASLGGFSQTVAIDHNSVGTVASNGIVLANSIFSVGGTVISGVSVNYNRLTSAGGAGIDVSLNDTSLAGLSQAVAVDHNTVGTVASDGIFLDNTIAAVSGPVSSGISVSDNALTSAGANGLNLHLNGSNLAGLLQTVAVDHNSIGTVASDGVAIRSNIFAVSGPVVTGISASYNRLTSAGGNGVDLNLNGASLAGFSQTLAVNHNTIGTAGSDGVAINDDIFAVSGLVVAGVSASYNSLTSAGGRGIYLHLSGVSLAGLSQTVAVDHNTIGAAGSDGVAINSNINAVSGPVVAGVSASYNSLTSAGGRGIYLHLNGVGLAGLSQTVAVDHNTIGTAGSDGVAINNNIFGVSGPVVSGISVSDNRLTSAGGRGIYLHLSGVSLAGLSQTVAVDHNTIGTVASHGIEVDSNIFGVSGPAVAGVSASYNSLISGGANGINLHLDGLSLAGLSQAVAMNHNSLGTVASHGISLNNNIFAIGRHGRLRHLGQRQHVDQRRSRRDLLPADDRQRDRRPDACPRQQRHLGGGEQRDRQPPERRKRRHGHPGRYHRRQHGALGGRQRRARRRHRRRHRHRNDRPQHVGEHADAERRQRLRRAGERRGRDRDLHAGLGQRQPLHQQRRCGRLPVQRGRVHHLPHQRQRPLGQHRRRDGNGRNGDHHTLGSGHPQRGGGSGLAPRPGRHHRGEMSDPRPGSGTPACRRQCPAGFARRHCCAERLDRPLDGDEPGEAVPRRSNQAGL